MLDPCIERKCVLNFSALVLHLHSFSSDASTEREGRALQCVLCANLHKIMWDTKYGSMSTTGCPKKNVPKIWRAVAPLNFELGIKVGGVLELSGSQL